MVICFDLVVVRTCIVHIDVVSKYVLVCSSCPDVLCVIAFPNCRCMELGGIITHVTPVTLWKFFSQLTTTTIMTSASKQLTSRLRTAVLSFWEKVQTGYQVRCQSNMDQIQQYYIHVFGAFEDVSGKCIVSTFRAEQSTLATF